MRLDDRRAARQAAIDHRVNVLRIKVLAERCRADDVEEHDGHLAQRLSGFGLRNRDCRQPGTQAGNRGLDHRIAEHVTLGLQCRDPCAQLIELRRHAVEDSKLEQRTDVETPSSG